LRNTKQVHTSTSRRYLKRRKPRDRSSETGGGGGLLCCDSTGKWGLEAIGEGGIFHRTPAAGELSMGQTTGCKAGRLVLVAAKHVGFYFWPSTIHLSPAAHMGTVDQLTTGQFQFMIESPMLLAIRWAHAHDNPSPPMLHPIPRRRIIRE
jgi:hypothetical protein